MAPQNLFSISIFLIIFRETLEASIIVSVLLGLVEQIVHDDIDRFATLTEPTQTRDNSEATIQEEGESDATVKKRLVRRLRLQIFTGAGIGILIAFALGAAFIAVWFTKASNLWNKTELLWEGVFEFIASMMIFVMGITMLKLDRAKAKWRIKLQRAFSDQHVDGRTKTGKWALFILPFVTLLREGLEAVVFVSGIALGQPAASVPIAAIAGLVCGLACGFLIYQFASRTTLKIFLVVMMSLILLIGAGLFSKCVWAFQQYAFNQLLGTNLDDTSGNGPGTYDVRGNVWHLDCCNPETDQTWGVFNSVFGWTNSATLGSVLSYVFYWVMVIMVLVYLKYKEGRTKFFGRESAAGIRRRLANEKRAELALVEDKSIKSPSEELPR